MDLGGQMVREFTTVWECPCITVFLLTLDRRCVGTKHKCSDWIYSLRQTGHFFALYVLYLDFICLRSLVVVRWGDLQDVFVNVLERDGQTVQGPNKADTAVLSTGVSLS